MLKPFIKWPGGKTSELKIIHKYMPSDINNYIEPFLGGGACFLSLGIDEYNSAFLNDLSQELISIYIYTQNGNKIFDNYLRQIWRFWDYFGTFADRNYNEMQDIYDIYKSNEISKDQLKEIVFKFVESQDHNIDSGIPYELQTWKENFKNELRKSIFSKFNNIKRNEKKKGDLPYEDYAKNFEAGIKAGVYTYNRYLYNNRVKFNISKELHIALFFYLREFCYSSMFRYNKNNEFNVPYGGASYNNKNFNNKIEYLKSRDLNINFKKSQFMCEDFESFLNKIKINEKDFMFLDPPYDTEFSTYANNPFDLNDQERLALYLINDCKCRFMLVIKNTDAILDLYENKKNINIMDFDKGYKVSFMDRNNKNVKHLLITNY